MLPPWAAGAAAALFVAGAAAFGESLVPPEAPQWPSLAYASAAWPWAAAVLHGLGVVSSIGIGLFVLHILDRVTVSWTRRAWIAVAAVVALFAVLVAAKVGGVGSAIAAGSIAGLIAAAVVYCVLRFDARTIPGYVIAAALVTTAEEAALERHRGRLDRLRDRRSGDAGAGLRGDALHRQADASARARTGTRGFDGVELSGRGPAAVRATPPEDVPGWL